MDKAVEQVERISDHFFSSHLILKRNGMRRGARLFGTAATMKPALAATMRPKSINGYAP
jgi:hypothetical protein